MHCYVEHYKSNEFIEIHRVWQEKVKILTQLLSHALKDAWAGFEIQHASAVLIKLSITSHKLHYTCGYLPVTDKKKWNYTLSRVMYCDAVCHPAFLNKRRYDDVNVYVKSRQIICIQYISITASPILLTELVHYIIHPKKQLLQGWCKVFSCLLQKKVSKTMSNI